MLCLLLFWDSSVGSWELCSSLLPSSIADENLSDLTQAEMFTDTVTVLFTLRLVTFTEISFPRMVTEWP